MKFANWNEEDEAPEFAPVEAPLNVTIIVCKVLSRPNELQLISHPVFPDEKPSTSSISLLPSTFTLNTPALGPTTLLMKIAVPRNWKVRLSPAVVAVFAEPPHADEDAQLEPS